MELLIILALAVWVFVQQQRIGALKRDFDALRKRLDAFETTAPEETSWSAPQPANEALPELLLTEVVEEDAPKEAEKPKEREPELLLTQIAEPAPKPRAPAPQPRERARTLAKWLSENGFAWIGGGLIAIGGVFMVAYASQQAFFTPIVRLIAALVLGAVLIGASEWVRRVEKRGRLGHPLVAALLAGAGAATLYAAAWAAYGVYGYITLPVAAASLAACAAILLALSLLHGQALGVLAVGAALLAPLLTSVGAWPPAALTIYLSATMIAGFGVSALQRWGWAAGVTLLAGYAWFGLSLADGGMYRALALLGVAALGGSAVGLREPRGGVWQAREWPGVHAYLPSIAIGISALLVILCWDFSAFAAPSRLAGPALAGMYLIGLSAMAVREGVARPAALQAAIFAVAIGLFAFARNLNRDIVIADTQFLLWALASAGVAGISALAAAPATRERTLISTFGALGALFMLLLAAITRPHWESIEVWAPLGVGSLLLAVAAELTSRPSRHPSADWSVDLWAGASAAALILALESLTPDALKPALIALAAFALAAVHLWRGWRAAASAALIAAAISLVHALSPDFTGAVWNAELDIWRAVPILFFAAVFQTGAAWLIRKHDTRADIAEALDTTAILSLLLAAFLALHWFAVRGEPLSAYVEDSLRALMLIVAGFVALPRKGKPAGVIARWRGHVMMTAGLVFGLYAAGYAHNPWWGAEADPVTGAPLLNANLLAFAAPAALAFAAANRLYLRALELARGYAIAGAVFASLWLALEIRRAFHGAQMALDGVGLIEGNAYGIAALASSCAVAVWARQRNARSGMGERPFTHDLARATGAAAIVGVLIAALTMLFARNAWWGGQTAILTLDTSTAIATLAQALAAALAFFLAYTLPKRASNACFAVVSGAVLFTLAFGALGIRWLHQHGLMDDHPQMAGVEGLLYAVWPLALVAGGAALTEQLRPQKRLHPILLDLEAIWMVAIWPALAFSAMGLWAFYNPWRGLWPAPIVDAMHAMMMLALYLAAAAFSIGAARLDVLQRDPFITTGGKIAAVINVFTALTLMVRFVFHPGDMTTMLAQGDIETWTYSAVWGLFGALVVGAGELRRDTILWWSGVAVLFLVTAKVAFVDTRALEGLVRTASVLGLGLVFLGLALAMRRIRHARD